MKKFLQILFLVAIANVSVFAFDLKKELEGDLKKYANELPGKGIVSDSIKIEGIKLSDFKMMGGKKIISCDPSELIDCQVRYEIDKDQLSNTKIHYFLVGFHNEGPQETVKKCLGFMSDSGKAKFTLEAPKEAGIYQIRFTHGTGLIFEQAEDDWWENPPGANTTMGIVIVK